MFQTKKALRRKIAELERELFIEQKKTRASAYIENSALPKCESLACVTCEHIVYRWSFDHFIALGCGKRLKCPDFQLAERSAQTQQSLQEALLRQLSL